MLLHAVVLAAAATTAAAATAKYNYIAFANCWTNPAQGARSELDFFTDRPATFGNAKPDANVTVRDGQNYVWENGGSYAYGDDKSTRFTFTVDNGNHDKTAGTQVGTAQAGSVQYVVLKEDGRTLYSDPPYSCPVFYYAVPKDSAAASSALASAASSTATASATSASASATSTGTGAPSPSPAPTGTDLGAAASATASSAPASSGLSQSAQVGVGVGVGVGGAALLAVAAFFLLRRRMMRNANRGAEPGIENMSGKHGIENMPNNGA